MYTSFFFDIQLKRILTARSRCDSLYKLPKVKYSTSSHLPLTKMEPSFSFLIKSILCIILLCRIACAEEKSVSSRFIFLSLLPHLHTQDTQGGGRKNNQFASDRITRSTQSALTVSPRDLAAQATASLSQARQKGHLPPSPALTTGGDTTVFLSLSLPRSPCPGSL